MGARRRCEIRQHLYTIDPPSQCSRSLLAHVPIEKPTAPLHTHVVAVTLSTLRIRNLALVEDLEWTLSRGFLAVTGETGSGKSIIIGALKLLLGERADKSVIRTGAESCAVEAVF